MSADTSRRVPLLYLAQLSIYWLGLNIVWGGMNLIYLPDRVETQVGTEMKGTYLGIMLAVGLVVAIIVQPVMGAVSDRSTLRWGRRRPFMLVGSLVAALFILLIAADASYVWLFAMIIVIQIAANSALGPYQGIMPDRVPRSQWGRASGFLGMAKNIGFLVGALVAGVFLDRAVPDYYLYAAAGVFVAVALISALTIHEDPLQEKPEFAGVVKELRTRLAELRTRPGFTWVLFSRLFFFMGLLAGDQILLFLVRERLGIIDNPGAAVTVALGVFIVVSSIVTLPAGWISDRTDRRQLIFVSCGIGVVGSLILIFTTNYPMLLVSFAVLGAAVGIFVTADWALALELIPDPRAPGLYMGLTNLATAGGDALGSLSAGIVLDTFNRVEPLLGYPAVFVMMAVFFALSAAIMLKVPKVYSEEAAGESPASGDTRLPAESEA